MEYLIKRRVEKLLKDSAVQVTVKCEHPQLPAHMLLNIGTPAVGFLPDMGLILDDEGFEANLKIRFLGPEVRRVRVGWASVIAAEPLPRPDPGGGKINLRRAA